MFKRKSECQRVQGMLSPYIDGQLGPSDKEGMESHLEGCQACRRELKSLRATVNLLHRVTMVSPPRSFAIAKAAPKPLPAAVWSFGVLRVTTAVAALLLVFIFAGDATHLFEGGLIEERTAQQDTLMDGEDGEDGEVSDTGGVPAGGEEYVWPVSELELALLGVVVVLGGATAVLWQRRRRGGERASKS